MDTKKSNFLEGRKLAHNVFWNLLGTGAPLFVAIFAIPVLIEGLGIARFGVLTIAWMVVGYFSLFDMGLGRALTKLVAEKLGQGQDGEIPSLVWTAISLMAVLGVLGAVVIALISPWLVGNILKIPVELRSETIIAFYLLALSIPIVIISTGLRGVLEAHQRFDLVNAVRIPLGISTFLAPVVVLPFSNSLAIVVASLVCVRLVSLIAYGFLCFFVEPNLRYSIAVRRALIWPLVNFGGWMTVTNIVSPLMVYMDRFIIGAVLSMTAVSYYATPYEVVTKLFIIPGALMGVLFPAFSAALAQDRQHASDLFDRAVNYIFISLFPVVLIIVTFSDEILTLWLGSDFSNNSSLVLQLLAVGVLINSHAHVPFGLIQGAGRPDIIAKLHLLELPFYSLILWWSLNTFGIYGAACAWVVRVSVDAILMFIVANRFLSTPYTFFIGSFLKVSMIFFVLAIGALVPQIFLKGGFLLIVLFIFALQVWLKILNENEKTFIAGFLKTATNVK
jgi:O-antigen/teichoic acid export membrane protein